MKEIKILPSKSDAHRALICSALSRTPCKVHCSQISEDIEATVRCLEALKKAVVDGKTVAMECGESGSTFRFMLPIAGALGISAEFYPKGRLAERPLSPLYEELEKHGCTMSPQGSVPFCISGQLRHGIYTLKANVSSQFISGLLMALPLLPGDSEIHLKGKIESRPYIDLTLKVMKEFSVEALETKKGFLIKGGSTYNGPSDYNVDGDWSNGAFWLVAGAFLEEGIRCSGLSMESEQGDKAIASWLSMFGAKVMAADGKVTVERGQLKGQTIDAAQIPDLIPPLALLASVSQGDTVIQNGGRLRLKESDRLHTIAITLDALGASVEEKKSGLIIHGKSELRGGTVGAYNDHRIAMMAAIASMVCREKVILTESESVKKSYPTFFDELCRLGLDNNLERK